MRRKHPVHQFGGTIKLLYYRSELVNLMIQVDNYCQLKTKLKVKLIFKKRLYTLHSLYPLLPSHSIF